LAKRTEQAIPSEQRWPRGASAGKTFLAVVAIAFVAYNANLRSWFNGDAVGSRYLPFSILRGATLRLDPMWPEVGEVPPGRQFHDPYWLSFFPGGRIYSSYPIVAPLLATPLDFPAAVLLSAAGWEPWHVRKVSLVMEKLSSTVLAALSVGLVALLLRRRVGGALVPGLTAAYAFGTSTWLYGSQMLLQHATAEILLGGALLAILAAPGRRELAVTGVCAGLLSANRPPDVVLALGLLAFETWRHRCRALCAWAAAAAAAAPFAVYDLAVFGTLYGGYAKFGLADPNHPFYRHSIPVGVAGLLVSPARGLFVFSPFLLLLALLPWRMTSFSRTEKALLAAVGSACAVQILFYARTDWRAGESYGNRFLTDMLPFLVWALAPILAGAGRSARRFFWAACAVAIGFQAVGVLCYPRGGSDRVAFPPGHERLAIAPGVWSWKKFPVLMEARGGLAPPDLPRIVSGSWRRLTGRSGRVR